MSESKRSRLSPEGRLRCREAGQRNIAHLLEARRAALPAVRQASMAFETALASEIGEKPTAAQQGLALSATASFTAITRALRELRSAHGLKRRIQALIEALPALQSELRRTLKALGVVKDAGDGPNADSSQAINAQLSAIENEIHGDRHDQNS